ncbi:MAG: flagellar hook-basal body complex protein, partial [Planctomycetota bacterium]
MGLQSAMTTALTGLQAAETTIDVIGNNVANSNTVGFKSSEVVFATQFLQTQSIGSAPSDRNGGTNPRQIGLGVKVAEIAPDFSQGTIEISSDALDLAIQGDGFLLVQGSQGEQLYTRNGQLGLNSENQVVTATGNKLLGFGIDDRFNLETARPLPIEIPLGGERVAQSTEQANFQGVLNPGVEAGTVPEIVTSEILTDALVERPDDAAFDSAALSVRTAPTPAVASPDDTGAPSPPAAAASYDYRVTYVDVNGVEGGPSTIFTATGVGANDRVEINPLPSDDAGGVWTGVNIYRRASDGEFRRVNTTPEPTSGTLQFFDAVDDATLLTNAALEDQTIDSGTYTYFVTFLNSANGDETRPSEALGPITVSESDSSVRLDLSNLQAPDNDQFNKIRIYRNASGDTSNFYLVDTISAHSEAAFDPSYVDTTPSSEISDTSSPSFRELDPNGSGSARADSATLLTDLMVQDGFSSQQVFEEGTLSFTGEVGGSDLATQELQITDTTNVQDLINFMTQSLGLQSQSNVIGDDLPIGGGAVRIENGSLIVESNFGEANAVAIPLTAFLLTPTDAVAPESVEIAFSQTQAANGPGTSTEFVVYDSLGSPLTVRLTTVLEDATSDSTTYRWYAASGDSQPSQGLSTVVGNGVMVFDSRGDLVSSPAASIS